MPEYREFHRLEAHCAELLSYRARAARRERAVGQTLFMALAVGVILIASALVCASAVIGWVTGFIAAHSPLLPVTMKLTAVLQNCFGVV